MFNDPPKEGYRFLLIRLEVENIDGGSEAKSINGSDFKLVGSSALLLSSYVNGCGVVPDELNTEFYEGGKTSGNVCFEVGNDEKDFILNYDHSLSDTEYWLGLGSSADKSG